jgi:hypothetical protein
MKFVIIVAMLLTMSQALKICNMNNEACYETANQLIIKPEVEPTFASNGIVVDTASISMSFGGNDKRAYAYAACTLDVFNAIKSEATGKFVANGPIVILELSGQKFELTIDEFDTAPINIFGEGTVSVI